MRVLVVNAGSSSLKLAVLDGHPEAVETTTVERWADDDVAPLADFLAASGRVDAVGHRVVHGGRRSRSAVVDTELLDELGRLVDLAPLHQPRALAGLRACARLLPDVPQVACFDTAFHATLPAAAATYALPAEWTARYGLRRYGFHGLSHAYAVRRAAALVGSAPDDLRIVSCHLGAGASLAAVRGGMSVDTTMGFTPLEGLVMATRSGSVDPGLLLWLLEREVTDAAGLRQALEHRSGLAGLSGGSGDLRDVRASIRAGDPAAGLAYDVFVHRLAQEAGAMVTSAGGLDVLVLTGGIGQNDPDVRSDLADRLSYLGVGLDDAANTAARSDADVSADGAGVRTVVVTAREDLEIDRQTRELVGS